MALSRGCDSSVPASSVSSDSESSLRGRTGALPLPFTSVISVPLAFFGLPPVGDIARREPSASGDMGRPLTGVVETDPMGGGWGADTEDLRVVF